MIYQVRVPDSNLTKKGVTTLEVEQLFYSKLLNMYGEELSLQVQYLMESYLSQCLAVYWQVELSPLGPSSVYG